jgi:hypothetical protein
MAGYDPRKAATYNKLRQSGLSDDDAAAQAGIVDTDAYNYVVNDIPGDPNRGTVGPVIFGSGTVSQSPTPAFEKVDYPVKAASQPSTRTTTNYVNTSTETISGGGSTTTISGVAKANAASRALQPSIDAKQAELDQFVKENPSNFAREKQGLPPLNAEDTAARQAKFRELSQEKSALKNQQFDAQTPGNPTTTVVPNTTTTVNTTTFGTSSNNNNVEAPDSADPAIARQEENQVAGLAVGQINNAPLSPLDPGDGTSLPPVVNVDITAQPDPVSADSVPGLLTPEQSIARAQVTPTDADPAVAAAEFNANTNAGVLGAIGVQEPEAVSAATPGTPEAESAFNQGALGTRAPAPVETPTAPAAPVLSAEEIARRQAEQAAIDSAAAEKAAKQRAQQQAAIQAEFQTPANGDWRVRLRLAPGATYLYKDADNKLLAPLAASDGVVFPYMPTIGTTYSANYDQTDLVHSNYKGYFYRNSAVDAVSITGKFTAQDTFEANYMLAVIHFFRSVTKMFYGQDWQRGAPPPLVFLSGLGEYQFNNHPCVVSSFNYSLPNDVDYIRTKPNNYNVDLSSRETKPDSGPFSEILGVIQRLKNAALPRGAVRPQPEQGLVTAQSVNNTQNSTYVPTSLDITITVLPIQTRKQISQGFSVQEFSKGTLLRKGFW